MILKGLLTVVAVLLVLDGQLLAGIAMIGFGGMFYILGDICNHLCELVTLQRQVANEDAIMADIKGRLDINA